GYGRVWLEDAGFTYPGADAPALEGVTLALEQGQWLGVVGASGAGKSTLVDLLAGALAPTAGRRRVAGEAGRVAYVPQSAYVREGTLLENVAPGAAPDRARAQECLELVRMPRGIDARVGDRGVDLSAGQRQRLALARALYLDPVLLVLD